MVLSLVLAAASLGPCADVSACTVFAPPPLVEAAKATGLKLAPAADKAPPLSKKSGDTAFALEYDEGASLVRARSLHRAPGVYGLSRFTIPTVGKKFEARTRQATLRRAIDAAMVDLQGKILESLGQGSRRLTFSVQLTGLDKDARAYVGSTLLPCLERQLELLGAVTTPKEVSGFLEDTVEYAPEANEPRESLPWQVERMRAALLGGPKAACTVLGSPLQPFSTLVRVDDVSKGVIVTFKR